MAKSGLEKRKKCGDDTDPSYIAAAAAAAITTVQTIDNQRRARDVATSPII